MTLKRSQTMGNLTNVDKPIVKKASSSTPNIKVKRDIAPRTPDRKKLVLLYLHNLLLHFVVLYLL